MSLMSYFGNVPQYNSSIVESLANYNGGVALDESVLSYNSTTKKWGPTQLAPTIISSFKFDTVGSTAYTPSAGAKLIQVYVTGGGGAGSGALTGTAKSVGPGGAGAGTVHAVLQVVPNLTAAITIGSGGTGVAGAAGNTGADSTFAYNSNVIVGTGGPGGPAPIQSSNYATSLISLAGSGTVTPGDGLVFHEIFFGQDGVFSTTIHQNNTAISGSGGSSRYGKGGDKISVETTSGFAGRPGSGYGAGGGGALQCDNAGTRAGGNGTSGVVYVLELA